MPYTIIYPDSGSDPRLFRESLTTIGVHMAAIGSLEPCDPSELETSNLGWYLDQLTGRVEPGTVVRIGPRTFACIREHVIAYYRLS